MNKGIFITGTDTGVGKTLVSAVILSALHQAGIDAVPMKPVQTGCKSKKGRLIAPDLAFVLQLTGIKTAASEQHLMCPYRFKPACSPHLAASMAGKRISFSNVRKCFRKLASRHSMVIVEGAGGVLVPLNGKKTMLDLMKMLDLPVILVARPGLGTINHTLLSINKLRGAGLEVKGVIFNETQPGRPGFIEKDNVKTIAQLGKVRILGYIPFGLRVAGRRKPTT